MPTKGRGSRCYHFDRQVEGVGRIQKSAKTTRRTEFRRRDGILTKLIEAGQLETLRLFKSGKLSISELVDADRAGRLQQVAEHLRLYRPLIKSVDDWLPISSKAKHSRRRYKTSWTAFTKKAQLTERHTIQNLAHLDYAALRTAYTSAADWNRARACLSRFLTVFLGHIHHPHRLEVMRQFRWEKEPAGRMPQIPPAVFWSVVKAADERVQASFVTMAVLGVGPAEYLGLEREHLLASEHLVHVLGTKTRERDRWVAVDERMWDWVETGVPSPLKYRWLNNYWNRACAVEGIADFRMYDLRHISAQYAGDRGATDRDLSIHLGHADPRMSHRYSRVFTARKVAKAAADRFLETA